MRDHEQVSDDAVSAAADRGFEWTGVLGLAVGLALMVLAERRYLTGWGGRAQGIRSRNGDNYMFMMARVGVVFRPAKYMLAFSLAFSIFFGLHLETDNTLALILASVTTVPTFGCVLWSIKELWSPSPRQGRPAWVDDLYGETGS